MGGRLCSCPPIPRFFSGSKNAQVSLHSGSSFLGEERKVPGGDCRGANRRAGSRGAPGNGISPSLCPHISAGKRTRTSNDGPVARARLSRYSCLPSPENGVQDGVLQTHSLPKSLALGHSSRLHAAEETWVGPQGPPDHSRGAGPGAPPNFSSRLGRPGCTGERRASTPDRKRGAWKKEKRGEWPREQAGLGESQQRAQRPPTLPVRS